MITIIGRPRTSPPATRALVITLLSDGRLTAARRLVAGVLSDSPAYLSWVAWCDTRAALGWLVKESRRAGLVGDLARQCVNDAKARDNDARGALLDAGELHAPCGHALTRWCVDHCDECTSNDDAFGGA